MISTTTSEEAPCIWNNGAGTSKTASLRPCRSSWMTICPPRTTSPGSAPFAMTDPSTSARKLGVAEAIPGGTAARLRRVDLRLRGLQLLLRLLVLHARGEASRQQLALPGFRLLRLRQHRLRGDELGFGGAQRVQFVLRVDPRHHLAGGDPVADGDPPLDQLAIDAKREIALFLGTDLPGQTICSERTRCSTVMARTGRSCGAGAELDWLQAVSPARAKPPNTYAAARMRHLSRAKIERSPDTRPGPLENRATSFDEQTRGCVHVRAQKAATASARSCEGGPAQQ